MFGKSSNQNFRQISKPAIFRFAEWQNMQLWLTLKGITHNIKQTFRLTIPRQILPALQVFQALFHRKCGACGKLSPIQIITSLLPVIYGSFLIKVTSPQYKNSQKSQISDKVTQAGSNYALPYTIIFPDGHFKLKQSIVLIGYPSEQRWFLNIESSIGEVLFHFNPRPEVNEVGGRR